MLLFNEAPPPKLSPLISIIIEKPAEVEPPQLYTIEPTIEEKIAQNYYGCDESVQYIRADDATCLNKPIAVPSSTNTQVSRESVSKTAVRGSNAPSGWYPYGQCTYWVSTRRPVGSWNNASEWLWQAKRDGYSTGSTPQIGAIAWEPGHVSYVEAVNADGTITISEMNYRGLGIISTRIAPASQFKFIY